MACVDTIISFLQAVGTSMYTRVSSMLQHHRHWPNILLIGLPPFVSISFGSADAPLAVSIAVLACYLIAAAAYAIENRDTIAQFGIPTAVALFALALFMFHRPSVRARDFLMWSPIYITLVLFAAVNVTPTLTGRLHKLFEALSRIVSMLSSISGPADQIGQDPDLEPGLPRNMPIAEDAHQTGQDLDPEPALPRNMPIAEDAGRAARLGDQDFMLGHVGHSLEAQEQYSDSLSLDSTPAPTTPEIQNWLQTVSRPAADNSGNV